MRILSFFYIFRISVKRTGYLHRPWGTVISFCLSSFLFLSTFFGVFLGVDKKFLEHWLLVLGSGVFWLELQRVYPPLVLVLGAFDFTSEIFPSMVFLVI